MRTIIACGCHRCGQTFSTQLEETHLIRLPSHGLEPLATFTQYEQAEEKLACPLACSCNPTVVQNISVLSCHKNICTIVESRRFCLCWGGKGEGNSCRDFVTLGALRTRLWKGGDKIVFFPLHENTLRAILHSEMISAALTGAMKYFPLSLPLVLLRSNLESTQVLSLLVCTHILSIPWQVAVTFPVPWVVVQMDSSDHSISWFSRSWHWNN